MVTKQIDSPFGIQGPRACSDYYGTLLPDLDFQASTMGYAISSSRMNSGFDFPTGALTVVPAEELGISGFQD